MSQVYHQTQNSNMKMLHDNEKINLKALELENLEYRNAVARERLKQQKQSDRQETVQQKSEEKKREDGKVKVIKNVELEFQKSVHHQPKRPLNREFEKKFMSSSSRHHTNRISSNASPSRSKTEPSLSISEVKSIFLGKVKDKGNETNEEIIISSPTFVKLRSLNNARPFLFVNDQDVMLKESPEMKSFLIKQIEANEALEEKASPIIASNNADVNISSTTTCNHEAFTPAEQNEVIAIPEIKKSEKKDIKVASKPEEDWGDL